MKQDTEADTTPIFSSKEGFTYIMNLMRRGKHKELYILFKDVTIPLNLSLEIMKRFLSDGRMIRLCKDPFVVNGHEKHISMVTQACYMTMFYLLSEEGNDFTVEDTGYNDDFFRERGKYDRYPLYYRAANWIPSYSPLIDIVMYQMAFIESLLASKDIPDTNRRLLFEVIGILSGFKDQHYEEVREGGKKCSPKVEYIHEKRIRGRDYLEAMGFKRLLCRKCVSS